MIQLYLPDNTNYANNGNITLTPSEATIKAELNGTWSATLTHPIDDDGRWKYISENCVVKMPSFQGNDQLFRIYEVVKDDTEVSCKLDPIFYDAAAELILLDVRPTNQNGQSALSYLIDNSSATSDVKNKYSVSSNLSKVKTAYYYEKNLLEAIFSNDDNAFLNRWGGEAYFNNYSLTINDRIGIDNGVELRYGKNIQKDGVEETVDFSSVVTTILPTIFNGEYPHLNGQRYVYSSPIASSYPIIRKSFIQFPDIKLASDATEEDLEEGSGITIVNNTTEMRSAIRERTNKLYDVDGIDKPVVTIKIEMALLQNTDLYEEYRAIENVSLGDTVHLIHSRLGIRTDARVIELEYDAILKKVSSVIIGKKKKDSIDRLSSNAVSLDNLLTSSGSVNAERISGILNAMKTQLRYQKNIAETQDVRAILFEDLDEQSNTYGAMSIGTQGFQIANRRTSDGRDWDWTTAFTAHGGYADAIIAGILSSADGASYFDLASGLLHAENAEITGTITGSNITGSTITGSTFQTTGQKSYCKLSDGKVEVRNSEAGVELIRNDELATHTWLGSVPYGFLLNVVGNTVFGIGKSENGQRPVGGYLYDPNPTNLSSHNRLIGSTIIENLTTRNTLNATYIVTQRLSATVSKSRLVKDTAYGDRLMYCMESPTPMFSDCGTAEISDEGFCAISVDSVFAETVNTAIEYTVFLQKEGQGDLWVDKKEADYFLVNGTPGLSFSWEIKSVQKGYENYRLDDFNLQQEYPENNTESVLNEMLEQLGM